MSKVNWTFDDTLACYKEGWAPFNTDDGDVVIYALDDPEGVAEDFEFEFKGIQFNGSHRDEDANEYVMQRAKEGSDLHIRALALVKEKQFVGD